MDTITLIRNNYGELQLPPNSFIPTAVAATVGTFDGVHKGHLFLFDQLFEKAKQEKLPTMAITFDKPPVAVVRPTHPYELLTENHEKKLLLAQTGLDYLVILPFDNALSSLSSEQFIRTILSEILNVQYLVSGYDNRFGKKTIGTPPFDPETFCNLLGMKFFRALPAFDKSHYEYSSSRIRNELRNGNIEQANQLLGYTYKLKGTVVTGNKLGRKFGFPTANICPANSHKLIPPDGVYAASAYTITPLGLKELAKGMLYIGTRPSLDLEQEKRIEINLFDFSEDLYGREVVIAFEKYIRNSERFETHQQLIDKIAEDEKTIRAFYGM